MWSAAYIAAVLLLSAAITLRMPAVTFQSLSGGQAVLILGCALTAGILGGILPTVLHENLGWELGPRWLERTAQLTGTLGFVYMAIRGFVLWMSIFVLGIVAVIIKWLWDLVVHFYST
ncbi:hypothetical protein HSX11_18670 [Oxalobacteraceae bacterium]|nr:hypothetical protein [Oxalobacteraceae bacterium]